MLGINDYSSPTNFDVLPKQGTVYSGRASRILFKDNYDDTKNPLRQKARSSRKPRGNTISPERSSKLTTDSYKENDDILDSLKKNLAMMDECKQETQKRIPQFVLAQKIKQRSNSENRNRNYEAQIGSNNEHFFTNKLK